MKRLTLMSALVVLLIGASSLAPATQYKYTSEEAKISVTFPSEFSVSEETNEDYKSVQVQAISDEMVFMVIYTVHNEDISESAELSEISFNAFMNGLEGNPTGKKDWKVKKYSGLQSTFDVASKDLVGDYRVVLIGQIQYQITAVAEKKSWNEKKAKKFFKSFKVKK